MAVKSGKLDSLSATWPVHTACDLFGLWALGSVFISLQSRESSLDAAGNGVL